MEGARDLNWNNPIDGFIPGNSALPSKSSASPRLLPCNTRGVCFQMKILRNTSTKFGSEFRSDVLLSIGSLQMFRSFP